MSELDKIQIARLVASIKEILTKRFQRPYLKGGFKATIVEALATLPKVTVTGGDDKVSIGIEGTSIRIVIGTTDEMLPAIEELGDKVSGIVEGLVKKCASKVEGCLPLRVRYTTNEDGVTGVLIDPDLSVDEDHNFGFSIDLLPIMQDNGLRNVCFYDEVDYQYEEDGMIYSYSGPCMQAALEIVVEGIEYPVMLMFFVKPAKQENFHPPEILN